MSDDKHHEIIIVKRGGDHEEGHHGGAWKIAFADFMTAMMAFFLVMWLISASDKTKAVIAHYFNPVQLVDSTPQPKGLQDLKADAQSIMKYTGTPSSDHVPEKDPTSTPDAKTQTDTDATAQNKNSEPDKTAKHEAELFRDPYAVLAEIAAKNDAKPKESKKAIGDGTKGGSGAVGLKGGEAYRDPFEPLALPTTEVPRADDALIARGVAEALQPPARAKPPAEVPTPVPAPALPPTPAPASAAEKPPEPQKAEPAKSALTKSDAQVAALQAKLDIIAKESPGGGGRADAEPKIEVRHTGEGTVIGLTDSANFAMFASASAEPSPRMVALMEQIGRLLKTQKGQVTIRGFTDSRPFKSDAYDNWRLSAARADMAHYMLARGGVDDGRFEKIEGYADRRPKNVKDTAAAENRRIEILLREPTP